MLRLHVDKNLKMKFKLVSVPQASQKEGSLLRLHTNKPQLQFLIPPYPTLSNFWLPRGDFFFTGLDVYIFFLSIAFDCGDILWLVQNECTRAVYFPADIGRAFKRPS